MPCSGMLFRVTLVKAYVSEERITLFKVTLTMEVIRSSETSVLTRATRRNLPEDTILHSHRRDNFKSCDM
jgi:hypothetical protein